MAMTATPRPLDPAGHQLPCSKQQLTPSRKRLLELMQQIRFGRIEGLAVRAGEPVLEPALIVVREVKFAAENGPRPEASLQDFVLKHQHRDLFTLLDEMGDGTIATLTVKHGLPFHAEVRG
jgi:hypothetical protein